MITKCSVSSANDKYQWYIDENGEIYKKGDILESFSIKFRIDKFIQHHRRSNKDDIYFVVRLQNLKYKTKFDVVPVELLGTVYIKENLKNE